MAQGFYSLDEAARVLGMAPEELSQMAQRREIRAFADRGTWRFRNQDVEELARRLGKGSSPDLQLGDAPRSGAADSPAPKAGDPEDSSVFTFSLGSSDEEVDLGRDMTLESTGRSSSRLGGKGPRSPKPGSDSDVRLVSEGSDVDFRLVGDEGSGKGKGGKSDVRLLDEAKSDSDVKIVPDQGPEDSAVPLGTKGPRKGSDSDIRLEDVGPPSSHVSLSRGPEDSMLTEEIDLDEEMRAAEEKAKKAKKKPKTKQSPAAAQASPFELSDSDLEEPTRVASAKKSPDSSSDIELTPADSSPISLSSSGEVPALTHPSSDEVDLARGSKGSKPVGAPDSGINLDAPADSGISLEQSGDGSDEIEFELSLDSSSTPKPSPVTQEDDSSSEFELTLDDSSGLAPIDSDPGAKASDSGEKDIFETDFEVPALDDESGSQAVALDDSDTDLESSDFDLALGDEDSGTEEDSGSQVVILDEGEADEGAATVARSGRRGTPKAAVVDDDSGDDVGAVVADDEDTAAVAEEDEEVPVRTVAAASADWGYMPALVMLPCTVVMLLVGIMGFELLNAMWGYRQPAKVSGPIVRTFSEMFGAELPKE